MVQVKKSLKRKNVSRKSKVSKKKLSKKALTRKNMRGGAGKMKGMPDVPRGMPGMDVKGMPGMDVKGVPVKMSSSMTDKLPANYMTGNPNIKTGNSGNAITRINPLFNNLQFNTTNAIYTAKRDRKIMELGEKRRKNRKAIEEGLQNMRNRENKLKIIAERGKFSKYNYSIGENFQGSDFGKE